MCVVSFEEFDELLRDDAISSLPDSELRAVAAVTRRSAEGRDTSLRRAITGVRWHGGVEAGRRPELVGKTPARVAVDQCLAMFSYACACASSSGTTTCAAAAADRAPAHECVCVPFACSRTIIVTHFHNRRRRAGVRRRRVQQQPHVGVLLLLARLGCSFRITVLPSRSCALARGSSRLAPPSACACSSWACLPAITRGAHRSVKAMSRRDLGVLAGWI